ncbi:hypothetical protein MMC12_007177 [Toensbergia leucococca]|nr:hypothetical protein [Toensbergia leucococca]
MAPSAVPRIVPDDAMIGNPLKSDKTVSKNYLLDRDLNKAPLKVISASGNYLTLENGRQILDATGGAAVACLGHGNKEVREVMLRQMDEVSYCHSLFFSTNSTDELARELIKGTGDRISKAFIVSSGSEAMEAAMKLARQYFLELPTPEPDRINFIARKHSYHGNTLGALSMSGHVARRALFTPLLLPTTHHISPCNAYRQQLPTQSTSSFVAEKAQELDSKIQALGPKTVIAFVCEPVVGAALGCIPSVPGYLKAMKAVCDKHGALFILDEVMCGMGRTGTLHAWEKEGVVPDIQTIGKGLGGGYAPIAGVLIGAKVVDALSRGTGAFMHGQTYQAHPLSCAAASAVQRIIREQNLLANVREQGAYLEQLLHLHLDSHPNVGNIRGRGLFWGIEFVRDKETKEPFEPSLGVARRVHEVGLGEGFGISVYPGTGSVDGVRGDHVILAPAYNVGRGGVERIVGLMRGIVEVVFGREGGL